MDLRRGGGSHFRASLRYSGRMEQVMINLLKNAAEPGYANSPQSGAVVTVWLPNA